MTATIVAINSTSEGRMRPLNILRDLPAVADLIELCFSSTLDPDGRSYIDQMRRNGMDKSFLNWAPRVIETVSLPLSGFVWESNGQVVGNVSLIPFFKHDQKVFLIANVATHPDFRRHGIARKLTTAALQKAREKHASAIWLHVRDDNPGAIQLYRELGFVERTRRTNWYIPTGVRAMAAPQENIEVGTRKAKDWELQNVWFMRAYPDELNWYAHQNWGIFKPGIANALFNFFMDIRTQQWSASINGTLEGVLACRHTNGRYDHLWMALPRHPDPNAITSLFYYLRHTAAPSRNLALEYPTGPADEALRASGLIAQRTLAWMEAPGSTTF